MTIAELILQGIGFILGGAAFWIGYKFKENSREHNEIAKTISEEHKKQEDLLNEIRNKID